MHCNARHVNEKRVQQTAPENKEIRFTCLSVNARAAPRVRLAGRHERGCSANDIVLSGENILRQFFSKLRLQHATLLDLNLCGRHGEGVR